MHTYDARPGGVPELLGALLMRGIGVGMRRVIATASMSAALRSATRSRNPYSSSGVTSCPVASRRPRTVKQRSRGTSGGVRTCEISNKLGRSCRPIKSRILETFVRDERRTRAFALNHRIRRRRHAVADIVDVAAGLALLIERAPQPVHRAEGAILRCRRHLERR